MVHFYINNIFYLKSGTKSFNNFPVKSLLTLSKVKVNYLYQIYIHCFTITFFFFLLRTLKLAFECWAPDKKENHKLYTLFILLKSRSMKKKWNGKKRCSSVLNFYHLLFRKASSIECANSTLVEEYHAKKGINVQVCYPQLLLQKIWRKAPSI